MDAAHNILRQNYFRDHIKWSNGPQALHHLHRSNKIVCNLATRAYKKVTIIINNVTFFVCPLNVLNSCHK